MRLYHCNQCQRQIAVRTPSSSCFLDGRRSYPYSTPKEAVIGSGADSVDPRLVRQSNHSAITLSSTASRLCYPFSRLRRTKPRDRLVWTQGRANFEPQCLLVGGVPSASRRSLPTSSQEEYWVGRPNEVFVRPRQAWSALNPLPVGRRSTEKGRLPLLSGHESTSTPFSAAFCN